MKAISRHTHGRSVAAAVTSGVLLLLVGGVFHAAAAVAVGSSADQDIVVQLGVHHFGDLRQPDAIVATAGPDDVGFYEPANGEGVAYGPQSFEVAPDGSIWLLDSINYQLLVWQPGRSTDPARIPLPLGIADFALGLDGTIYATYPDPGSELKTLRLCALSPSGEMLWTAPTTIEFFNAELLTGPDGSVDAYVNGDTGTWTPLTSPDGQVLTVDEQREGTTSSQLLAGGQGLTRAYVSPKEERFTLTDRNGRVVRAWRVTSDTALGSNYTPPTLVGGDLVVALEVWKSEPQWVLEDVVLRLSPTGAIQRQFALDTSVWGDALFAQIRVGPDGQLYQLSTDPATGASIARFALDPAPVVEPSPPRGDLVPAAPTETTNPAEVTTSAGAHATSHVISRASSPVVTAVASPVASSPDSGWSMLAALAVLGGVPIALVASIWYVRRRRASSDRPLWHATRTA